MAPQPLKRLTALQIARLEEMKLISARFRDKSSESLNKAIVQARIDGLTEIWNEVRKTHSDILAKEDIDNDAYIVDNRFAVLRETYEDANDLLLTARMTLESTEGTRPRPSNGTSAENNGDASVPKLPRIPLPTFSGRYEDWESFSDLFTALVHDVPRYSNSTKLQFLKTCLTGSTAELVKDVKTTNANYISTWQALKTRYHNPRLMIFKHFVALMKLPYLKRESAIDMRSFADEAQRIVRALTNLKLPVSHWNLWFGFVLSERLDPESRKLWEAELSSKDRLSITNMSEEDYNPIDHLRTMSSLNFWKNGHKH